MSQALQLVRPLFPQPSLPLPGGSCLKTRVEVGMNMMNMIGDISLMNMIGDISFLMNVNIMTDTKQILRKQFGPFDN